MEREISDISEDLEILAEEVRSGRLSFEDAKSLLISIFSDLMERADEQIRDN
jgi:hypothetical protein